MPIDHDLIDFYYAHPEKVPVPAYLSLALPMSKADLASGALGHFMMELSTNHGFRDMSPERLQECVATGFGYPSWSSLLALDAKMADAQQLPPTSVQLIDAVAWRMYAGGFTGLCDAMVALQGAWSGNTLQLKRQYINNRISNGAESATTVNFSQRHVPGLETNWASWNEASLTEDGLVRVKFAAEMAHEVAQRCWTPNCGVSLEQLNAHIEEGAHMPVETLIDRSWYFSEPWPTGLSPIQFMHADGRLAGFGWYWREIGMMHCSVFATPADFKKSAVALWHRQPIGDIALKSLPANLVQVAFENPWDPRDLDSETPDNIKAIIAIESQFAPGPWMDLIPTKDNRISLGMDLQIDNEPWTRPNNSLDPRDLEGVLGLQLPSLHEAMEEVGEETQWLQEKVPYGLDQLTFDTLMRLLVAVSKGEQDQSQWHRSNDSQTVLSRLLKLSATMANPVPARDAESTMADPFVQGYDVRETGEEIPRIYPELAPLPKEMCGEYAIAFYGKNGVRHDRRHLRRDDEFMLYAVVRNLGADPGTTFRGSIATIFNLVRLTTESVGDSIWTDPVLRAKLSEQTRHLSAKIRVMDNLFDKLDNSLSASRLALIHPQ